MDQRFPSLVDEKTEAHGYYYDDYYQEILKINNMENEHFWCSQRNRIIGTMYSKYASKGDRCIETGAGSGGVAQYLSNLGYKMAVGKLHPAGSDFLKDRGLEEIYQIDSRNIP